MCFNNCDHPEFDCWRWVNYWHPLGEVVAFKRKVYQRALNEFASLVLPDGAAPAPRARFPACADAAMPARATEYPSYSPHGCAEFAAGWLM